MTDDHGFSLIEALIALAILTGVGAVVAVALSTGDERSARAMAQFRNVLAAGSILDRVGLDIALDPAGRDGRTADGAGWTVEVEPYSEQHGGAVYAPIGLAKVRVTVTPARPSVPAVTLITLRALDRPGGR